MLWNSPITLLLAFTLFITPAHATTATQPAPFTQTEYEELIRFIRALPEKAAPVASTTGGVLRLNTVVFLIWLSSVIKCAPDPKEREARIARAQLLEEIDRRVRTFLKYAEGKTSTPSTQIPRNRLWPANAQMEIPSFETIRNGLIQITAPEEWQRQQDLAEYENYVTGGEIDPTEMDFELWRKAGKPAGAPPGLERIRMRAHDVMNDITVIGMGISVLEEIARSTHEVWFVRPFSHILEKEWPADSPHVYAQIGHYTKDGGDLDASSKAAAEYLKRAQGLKDAIYAKLDYLTYPDASQEEYQLSEDFRMLLEEFRRIQTQFQSRIFLLSRSLMRVVP